MSSGERVAYHTAWIQHARHSINNPRLAGKIAFDGASDGLYANGRFATDASAWEHLDLATYRPAITSLPRLLMMSKEELVARVADALCDLDDVKVETVVSHVAERLYRAPVVTQLRVGVDLDILAAFLDKNQDAIRATMRTRFAAERREDVARTIADLAAYPQLSAHEVWLQGAGAKRHRDVSYFADLRANELAPYLTRPVDRMGNEPNYLLAAQLARFLLGAEPGTSFSSAVADFKELAWDASLAPQGWTDFTVADAERLSRIYTFIPCWHTGAKGPYDLGIDDLPEDIHSRFTKLAQVPFSTSIMRDYAALRGER
ncbi:MAG TPA: hypothetical protein VLC93_09090, partial [Myxococcota bacterium]|nr:hypothetical protein [Myxococcota bacterium]